MIDVESLALLRSASTIRERCRAITGATSEGRSQHFTIDRSKLDAAAERVATLTRSRYPDLRIPYHSRWRHFEAGGMDRKGELDAALAGRDPAQRARARIDLTVISVLLDAGAGPAWRFTESPTTHFARSEGLAVASFRAFMQGRFSSDAGDPWRVDAQALSQFDELQLAAIFQVTAANPLVGLAGRADLLRRLAFALRGRPDVFGEEARPGRLFDTLQTPALRADDLLRLLLDTLSGIWPSGQSLDGAPLGDVWRHPHANGHGRTNGLVPFHKLSQWLTYSLLEPIEWSGHSVVALDALTGLPEYRNGGLMIDAGIIVPREPNFAALKRTPADSWVIEWRALTVDLLDELAPLVRQRLGATAEQLPLARILEGGTWAAGRQIAAEHRAGGVPPVQIDSDGTVF